MDDRDQMSDYLKFRGKCKELVEEVVSTDPMLEVVRGHYICPFWGEQEHWWAEKPDGKVVDPSAKQFPSKGKGEYIPFDGMVNCAECGKEMREEDAQFQGNYPLCSHVCTMIFLGVGDFL